MPTPPRAPRRPIEIIRHGHTRTDDYFWLRDAEDPEVLAHLGAENEFVAASLADQASLEETLFEEIKSRIEETDISVPVRKGDWWYFERTREGLNYPVSCRAPAVADDLTPPVIEPDGVLAGEQVILDENLEAEGHDFLSVGVLAISPDDAWVAVGVDFDGDERHTVSIRPLLGHDPLDDLLEDVHYGFAWANDSRHVFYTRVDEAMRPWQVWRHEVGTSPDADVLVFQESDAQYNVAVGRSRDDAVIVIATSSSSTSEYHVLDADRPCDELRVVMARREGVEYALEHWTDPQGRGWWLMITNEDATDFRLLARARDDEGPWREVLAHRPGRRLDGVDAFADFLALSERVDGCATVSLVTLLAGDDPFADLTSRARLIEGGPVPSTVGLSANALFATDRVRVILTSLVTPRFVADVDVATGALTILKQQRVLGGYDADRYVTGRLWVRASDGVRVPVSLVARRDLVEVVEGELRPLSVSPLLLYGYGSYEISIDPGFSSLRLSLLDRGVIFAIAHVRGGGEMGRAWYEMGRLAQKPTTFSDFVAVARHLVAKGWTEPSRLAIRGGSAGGLLVGAVMNLAPDLFRCVVAEVPFVDVVTTMLDASLPLTVGEWEEWGNPDADPRAYRTMLSYSPYDNVRLEPPTRYPDLLATGGLNDSRVGFWEPAKWVQRVREAHPDNVAYVKTEMGAGHGGPSGRYDAWRDEAQVLSFIVSEIAPDS